MQYKRVISFGDSFTYGTELSDCVDVPPTDLRVLRNGSIDNNGDYSLCYSKRTWPALTAKMLNAEYFCNARSGLSNQGIARSLLENLSDYTPDDLLVINWTYISRWEYYDQHEPYKNLSWKTIRPDSDCKVSKFYYTHLESELSEKWQSLQLILMTLSVLKLHNISFFTTCQDTLVLDQTWHVTNYIKAAQREISNDLFWFDEKGFNEWAEGYPRGDNGHPLEDAHQAAFEYIRDNHDFTK
jgi:hypothetical protein